MNIEVSQQSESGTFSKRQAAGCVYVTARYKNGSAQICVDGYKTTAENGRERRDEAAIYISFRDGSTWSGTLEDLQRKLNP